MNKLGFGFLRLPHRNPQDEKDIDIEKLNQLVDAFIDKGGTYFDTAYTYLDGASEEALRKTLVERYPRESYQICSKLPGYLVEKPEDCRKFFDEQLKRCGVTYFDVYMLHWLTEENYEICERFDEFAFLRQLKDEGSARRIGFSFHGSAALLDRILEEHPEVDCVLLQINYLDWESPSIQSRQCYETAVRHGKSVVVMEPIKGGSLANLPEQAARLLHDANPALTQAAWALQFVHGLEHVEVVLSGMNDLSQIGANMDDQESLKTEERRVLIKAVEIINSNTAVPCTGCGYCVSGCPAGIPIPRYFSLYNEYERYPDEDWKMGDIYQEIAKGSAPASACIGCGACTGRCPQRIEIPEYINKVAKVFEPQ